MANGEIYLDCNATTTPRPEVVAAVVEVMAEGPLNPASAHSLGEQARRRLERARAQVSDLVGATSSSVIFTSGGTEANHLVLRLLLQPGFEGFRLVTTAVEHSAIRGAALALAARGRDVVTLDVNEDGLIDLDQLRAAIIPANTLVALQWANNETGTLQPIQEASEIVSASGGWLHCDAVQAAGKIPIAFDELRIDSIAISAHKLHGPSGIGALVLDTSRRLPPLMPSGDQEGGIRPGTQHLAGAVGFGIASELRKTNWVEELTQMERTRDLFEKLVIEAGTAEAVNGANSPRLPNTTNLRFKSVEGDALVARLDMAGVICSQNSACTAMRPEPSFVLRSMGLSEDQSYRSIRFSTSAFTTEREVMQAATILQDVHTVLTQSPLGDQGE